MKNQEFTGNEDKHLAGESGKVRKTAERREYQPKTGAACYCKRGIQRDNCPNCEGTGQVIDFAAIRARTVKPNPVVTLESLRGGYYDDADSWPE